MAEQEHKQPETYAEYIIALCDNVPESHRNYLIKRIAETGLMVEFVNHDNEFYFLKIYMNKKWLIHYLSNEQHMEEYLQINSKGDNTKIFLDFQKLPKSAILPSSLNRHVIHSTLENISIDNEFILLMKNNKHNDKHKLVLMDKLITICIRYEIISDIFPMCDCHDFTINIDTQKYKLWNLFFNIKSIFSHVDHTNNLNKIRDYFGEEHAFYFAFMDHYIKWLSIPGIIGFLFWFIHISHDINFDIDDSAYIPFYALFVCIWGHFMIKYWNRRATNLSLLWNTIDFKQQTYLRADCIRPEFKGIIRQSPITDLPERYYPSYKRYPIFLFGILITLFLLFLVFIVMICSLNMQGYIHSQKSIIYIEYFNSLSKPGALFDHNSMIMSLIPVLCHCTFVYFMNTLYSSIAEKLCVLENWKYEEDFENSLILKRFLFEFLDAFLPLFYICFYEMKMEILTEELFSLFLCDEIRRIATESLIPFLLHLYDLRLIKNKEKTHFGESHNILLESRLDDYSLFDDYLEMITQFGYITLFASCYPLASIISLISNIFEVWSDSFSLCFLSKRPVVERAFNIHSTWVLILKFMAWFSILTNCYIFAFSSEQMEEWFPHFYVPDDTTSVPITSVTDKTQLESGYEDVKQGHGRYIVFIMFGFEHIIAGICLLIQYLISNIPNNVNIQIQRKEHVLYQQYIENIKKKHKSLKNTKTIQPKLIQKET